MDYDKNVFTKKLLEEMNKKNNVKAVFSFLSEEKKNKFANEIAGKFSDSGLHKNNYLIYNTVKNSLPETETKVSSKKFLAGIQFEVERQLDIAPSQFKNDLWEIWECINDELKKIFLEYFDEEAVSKDGYYYKDIDLNNPDETFINAMFTSNNIQCDERLSLEVI